MQPEGLSRRNPKGLSDLLYKVSGAVAQLGERLLCKQDVVGSIPSGSTNTRSARIVVNTRSARIVVQRGRKIAAKCRVGERKVIRK